MQRLILVSLCLVQVLGFCTAYDLDETEALFSNLTQVALGNIGVGHIQIDDLAFDIQTFRQNSLLTASTQILSTSKKYESILAQIKVVALGSKKNITSCFAGFGDFAEFSLPYISEFGVCIINPDQQAEQITSDASYRIDVIMSQVYYLEFELTRCADYDEECITKVANDIIDLTNDMPSRVQVEIDQLINDSWTVLASMYGCCANSVVGFTLDGLSVIDKINQCAEI